MITKTISGARGALDTLVDTYFFAGAVLCGRSNTQPSNALNQLRPLVFRHVHGAANGPGLESGRRPEMKQTDNFPASSGAELSHSSHAASGNGIGILG
jgi:hypothetical protein